MHLALAQSPWFTKPIPLTDRTSPLRRWGAPSMSSKTKYRPRAIRTIWPASRRRHAGLGAALTPASGMMLTMTWSDLCSQAYS